MNFSMKNTSNIYDLIAFQGSEYLKNETLYLYGQFLDFYNHAVFQIELLNYSIFIIPTSPKQGIFITINFGLTPKIKLKKFISTPSRVANKIPTTPHNES